MLHATAFLYIEWMNDVFINVCTVGLLVKVIDVDKSLTIFYLMDSCPKICEKLRASDRMAQYQK